MNVQTGLVFDLIDSDGQLLGSEGTSERSKKVSLTWLEVNKRHINRLLDINQNSVEKKTVVTWKKAGILDMLVKTSQKYFMKNIPILKST